MILLRLVKDKLEDMDVSLNFVLFPSGATIFTRSLWQIQRTEFQAKGTKWKIWIWSFHWYLKIQFWLSSLVTVVGRSWVFFLRFSENDHFHPAVKIVFLITFFQKALIWRWVDLQSWNQLQMASNTSNFHAQKKAFKNLQPSFCN